MKACIEKKTIEMSKSEAKAAGKINSEKYRELQEYRAAYPGFEIAIIATTKRKNAFDKISYDFMRAYIKAHDSDDGKIMSKFYELTAQDKKEKKENSEFLVAASYFEVKKWFLAQYPEIKQTKVEHQKRINEILASTAA